jgi:hypothetical protein
VVGCTAAAVTAAVLTDEWRRRDGDSLTDSCLAAIELDREIEQGRHAKVRRLRAKN